MECIITYQKSNGEIFIRPYDYSCFTITKKVGDETSMGWKILDIHYRHGNNFYCYQDFMRIFRKGFESELKMPKKTKKKKLLTYLIKALKEIDMNTKN